jgi:hypothetical protein
MKEAAHAQLEMPKEEKHHKASGHMEHDHAHDSCEEDCESDTKIAITKEINNIDDDDSPAKTRTHIKIADRDLNSLAVKVKQQIRRNSHRV